MLANKPFKILTHYFSTGEKKLPKEMKISYAIRISVIRLAVTGTMAVEICESLNLMTDQAMDAPIRQPQALVTDLSFAAPDKKIIISTPTNQKSLLS